MFSGSGHRLDGEEAGTEDGAKRFPQQQTAESLTVHLAASLCGAVKEPALAALSDVGGGSLCRAPPPERT